MKMTKNRCNLTLPFGITAGIIYSLLTKQARNLHADAVKIIRAQGSKIRIIGEALPEAPFLITVNHFSRPGFSILWVIMGIHAKLDEPTHWMMSNVWTFPGRTFRVLYEGVTAWIFKRIAHTYDFISTPALPPLPENSMRAALAIRSLVRKYRSEPHMTLGLSPEGRDFPDGKLGTPSRGTGLMINELLKIHPRILPVGFYFKDGQYTVHFGSAYNLKPMDEGDRELIDKSITRLIMQPIADLLPFEIRGDFS